MAARCSVTIDTRSLAIPRYLEDRDAVLVYLERLISWGALLKESWIILFLSERACDVLCERDLYPIRDDVKKLFDAFSILEYDVNTVSRLINAFLKREPRLEQYYQLADVLVESIESNGTLNPIDEIDLLDFEHLRCLLLLALLERYSNPQPVIHRYLVNTNDATTVTVRSKLLMLDHKRDDFLNVPLDPAEFEGQVIQCNDLNSVVDSIDAADLLYHAEDVDDVNLAIRIASYQYRIHTDKVRDWGTTHLPRVHDDFYKTCFRVCKDQAPALASKILRAIVETIYGHNMASVHALRGGMSGNTPVRTRNGDTAQRRDIDRTFHLHYWECTDGSVEIASVVYHDDFSIPY